MTDTIELTFEPFETQFDAVEGWMDDTTVEIVYGGAKGGGKSYLGATLIFNDALTYPDTAYFIARKELNDLRKHTLPTIKKVFKDWKIDFDSYVVYNGQDNYFKLYNGSRVLFMECKYNPGDELYERFGSMEMTRGWIEEAGEIEEHAKENLLLTIGRMNNKQYGLKRKLLLTCNPKKNFLYSEFYKPWINGALPKDKMFIQAFAEQNKYNTQDYLEALYNTKDKVMRERLVLGNWEYDDDPNALMEYDDIAAIFTNDHVEPSGRLCIVVDVAREGDDKTVIRVWDGLVVIETIVLDKKNIVESSNVIKERARKYGIPMHRVLADEDGVGGGLVDILGCTGFLANSSPINPKPGEKYRNLKTQCAFKLAELVAAAKIYEPLDNIEIKEMLTEDLQQIKKIESQKENMNEILSKKAVKRILGRSPDHGDTYIMRMYFEVAQLGIKAL